MENTKTWTYKDQKILDELTGNERREFLYKKLAGDNPHPITHLRLFGMHTVREIFLEVAKIDKKNGRTKPYFKLSPAYIPASDNDYKITEEQGIIKIELPDNEIRVISEKEAKQKNGIEINLDNIEQQDAQAERELKELMGEIDDLLKESRKAISEHRLL